MVQEWRYTVYAVDASTDGPDAERTRIAEFRAPDGRAELEAVYSRDDGTLGSG